LTVSSFDNQVKQGLRFKFGKNWKNYLKILSRDRIKTAEKSLLEMLEKEDLNDLNFLDIGCGSGLFSLAAINLGAKVYSIDFDPDSITCTEYIKKHFHPNSSWYIVQASVLDKEFLRSIGEFDIVYSWGVLHHTGNLDLALENVLIPLKNNGKLFIGIYNDQGKRSTMWKTVKKLYNSNFLSRILVIFIFISYYVFRFALSDLLKVRNPLARYMTYKQRRGMSMWYDWIDWLGGYPYEVAKPNQITGFFEKHGLQLAKLKTTKSAGVNEFVFMKLK